MTDNKDFHTPIDKTQGISLLDLIFKFEIGGVPIIYFILVYIILVILNRIYLFCDSSVTLVGTIPITIIISFLIHKHKIGPITLIVFILTTILLIYLIKNNCP